MKLPTGKDPFAQHGEEDVVGDEAWNGDGAPAGARLQDRVQAFDVGNAGVRQLQEVDAVKESADHAGAEQVDLPREQQVPNRVVLVGETIPALRNHIILPSARRLFSGDCFLQHLRSFSMGNKKPAERGAGGLEAGELSDRRG